MWSSSRVIAGAGSGSLVGGSALGGQRGRSAVWWCRCLEVIVGECWNKERCLIVHEDLFCTNSRLPGNAPPPPNAAL